MKIPDPTEFKTNPGRGVDALYGNKRIMIGIKMMETEIPEELNQLMSTVESEGKTAIPVALDKSVIGVIVVADTVRENSLEAIQRLKRLGIKTVMITGDNMRTAGDSCWLKKRLTSLKSNPAKAAALWSPYRKKLRIYFKSKMASD